MAKPANKQELLDAGEANFKKLTAFTDALSSGQQKSDFPGNSFNRNIRDVYMHLHHWHTMMLEWYKEGMKGKTPPMPAEGYTWKTTPQLNQWIKEHYSSTDLETAKQELKKSYNKVRKLIEKHANEELFEKKRYKWTGSTSLGAYFISATASHYDWAYKVIKKNTKT